MSELHIESFDPLITRLLIARGVPAQDLPPKRTRIDIGEALNKIQPDIPNSPVRSISALKQYKVLASVLDHPLRTPYTLGISGFPSDLRAKYLAMMIMASAIEDRRNNPKPGKGLPLWHRVYGGYVDQLRDKPLNEMPSMLVIANVGPDSTAIKMEKVRDLLEKFADIPRIVVTSKDPPCNLFANRLYYPMKAGFYIGPARQIREV